MVASLTGTPSIVTWTSGVADPAGQSITVPSGTIIALMFWSYFNGVTGQGLASVTLNGNNPDQTIEITGTAEFGPGGIARWDNPSSGSQTLDPAWDGAPGATDGGPLTTVAYIIGAQTGGWGDADTDQSLTAASVTLTTTTTDLVLKYDIRYSGGTPSGPPATSSGWTSQATQDNNQIASRLSTADSPGASSTVCNAETEAYTTLVAVSILEAAGGGGGVAGALGFRGLVIA